MAIAVRTPLVPTSHEDLLDRPLDGRLSTILPDGYAQTHPVWFDREEDVVRINTMRGFRKERNMRADPRVSLLVIDPDNANRWLEIRGRVTLTEEGAREHLDRLTWRYVRRHHFFGGAVEARFEASEFPVLGRITPALVVTSDTANARTRRSERSDRPGPPPWRGGAPDLVLPASHLDLLTRYLLVSLTTFMPDGQPQTQPVWADFDGRCIRVNTTRERIKGRNLELNPRATVLAVDPADDGRWIEVRGDVEIVREGALEHLDMLAQAYAGKPRFYGGVYPEDFQERETRIICRLHPRHVVRDAIHH